MMVGFNRMCEPMVLQEEDNMLFDMFTGGLPLQKDSEVRRCCPQSSLSHVRVSVDQV